VSHRVMYIVHCPWESNPNRSSDLTISMGLLNEFKMQAVGSVVCPLTPLEPYVLLGA
jgi:hypothetical protein